MLRKRPLTGPPPPGSNVFAVRCEDLFEPNKHEKEAWGLFMRCCAAVPEGSKVELLREGRVVAWLNSAGTRVQSVIQSLHAAPAADVA